MTQDFQLRKIADKVDLVRRSAKVGVYVDLDGLLYDMDSDSDAALEDEEISSIVERFSSSIGRICVGRVYISGTTAKEDDVDHAAWKTRGFQEVFTHEDGFGANDANLDLLLAAQADVITQKVDTVVLVSGRTDYNVLARTIAGHGVAVVNLCNYPHGKRILRKNECMYIPTRSVFYSGGSYEEDGTPEPDTRDKVAFDESTFDYRKFIRLLAASEDLMPFVGVSYFVRKVMWRLGEDAFQDVPTCQQLFQAAKERGIVEVYERENINNSGNQVSACRLLRDNELVQEVLEELDGLQHAPGYEDSDADGDLERPSDDDATYYLSA
jgi:hypothetical protein